MKESVVTSIVKESETSVVTSIVKELEASAERISQEDIDNISDLIQKSNRVFVAGAGRSGFMTRAFVNRLMHLGFTAYFVGEPTTPSIQTGDLLIIGSGSGETGSLVTMANKAKAQSANVALVTIYPESTIGKLSSTVVTLPGSTQKSKQGQGTVSTIQPLGSLFEQLLLITLESVVLTIKIRKNMSDEEMFSRHANLE